MNLSERGVTYLFSV